MITLIFLCFTQSLDASVNSANIQEASPLILITLSIATVIVSVIVLLICADLCKQQPSFQDFENEEETQPELNRHMHMMPPLENTPDNPTGPIYFEPLPDASQLRPSLSNEKMIRPKIASLHITEKSDKLHLERLLTAGGQQLPRTQLQYIKELGTGYFGKVLRGEGLQILPGHKRTKVVIQMMKEDCSRAEQLVFLQEALAYREVDHPNVLHLLGQCVESSPYLLILELSPFGDLKTYLRSHRVAMQSFNEKGLPLKFASDIAAGMMALHQHNFIHRDLAIRNCLLASDLGVKIGDYGISESTFLDDYYLDANNDPIPIRWLAPESLSMSQNSVSVHAISKEANIWSYGVVLWEITNFGALPYGDLSNEHVKRLVIQERSVTLPKPDVALSHIERLYQLMQLCWKKPEQRCSLRELRIMLLHLLSHRADPSTHTFEQKWQQLMPCTVIVQPDSPQPLNAAALLSTNTKPDVLSSGHFFDKTLPTSDDQNEAAITSAVPSPNITKFPENIIEQHPTTLSRGDEIGIGVDFLTPESTVVDEDQSDIQSPMPDIIATSNGSGKDDSSSPEGRSEFPKFMTSTPEKKVEQSGEEKNDIMFEDSTLYHTPTSNDGSSVLSDERKFAAMLMTVAAPSFEESDMLSSSFSSLQEIKQEDGTPVVNHSPVL